MKSRIILYFITYIALAIQFGCVNDADFPEDMINAKVPEVVTNTDDFSSTASSITISAEVVKENGMPVTEYGAYYSHTSPIDTIHDKRISVGKGKGKFSVTIEGVKKDTVYYVAPYAINRKGIALGEMLLVKTEDGAGVVSTLAAIDSTATTARIGGKIINPGEGEIKSRGVYLSTTPGFTEPMKVITSDMKTDSFVCLATGLTPDTRYYYKAFVENTYSTFVGLEMSFKTTLGIPVVGDIKKIAIGFYDAEFEAELISGGDSPVTESGFCWKENETPTIDDSTLVCLVNDGYFRGKIENLSQNVRYCIRPYAINSFGITYGKDTVFSPLSDSPTVLIHKNNITLGIGYIAIEAEVSDEGLTPVDESGLCWSTSNLLPDTTDNKMAISSGRTTFLGTIDNLTGSTTYYVRAYGKNELKIQYSEVYSFTTPPILVYKTPLNKTRTQGTTRFCNSTKNGFLLGGDSGAEYTNELWRYDADVDRWLDRQAYPERNVSGQTPVYLNERLYVLGGKKDGEPINNFYVYSVYKNEWESITPASVDTPAAVAFSSGCVIGDAIYYFGGQHSTAVSGEVWKYSPVEEVWEKTGDLPEEQHSGIALVHDDILYAGLGLKDMSGNTNNKKLWASSDQGNTWSDMADIPNEATQVIGGVVFQNKIYVIDNEAQIWEYTPEDDIWKKKSKLDILEKNVHCIYVLNKKIYIGLGSRSDQFVTYDPDWDN